tara:strand:- start:2226 stop:3878 length:1653 start_codon:yes stop_codon:yes gene_type:complete
MAKKEDGGKILANCLSNSGVKTIFTVPGESFLAVLNGLYDYKNKIKIITCRHEACASNMAEASGKLTGFPGIAFVTRGPGACHASIGVHTAMQDSSPMILFIGQINSKHRGKEAFQEINYYKMFEPPFSKRVFEISNSKNIPEIIKKSFEIAINGRPGPVIISLPENILEIKSEFKPIKQIIKTEISPNIKKINEVIKILKRSRKPMIIIGGGDWNNFGAKDLVHFANKNDIPFAVSFRRQSLVNNKNKNYIGDLSTSVDPNLTNTVKNSDLILVVGARLGEMTTGGYTTIKVKEKNKIIHVYPDKKEIGKVFNPILGIHSNSNSFSKAIKYKKIKNINWSKWATNGRQDYLSYMKPPKYNKEPNMGKIMLILREIMPKNTIITIDAGNFSGWIQRFWSYSIPKTQLAPTSGAMGYAIPAAISAKLTKKGNPVIAFCGDGGFMMSSQELATCHQFKINPIIILINNNMFGTIRMHQEKNYPNRKIATDLINPNFKSLCKGYNAHYENILHHKTFKLALKRSLKLNKATVIEIKIDPQQITTRQKLKDLNN